jgi:hypothetical protein
MNGAREMIQVPIKIFLLAVLLSLPLRISPDAQAIAADGLVQATARLSGRVSVAGSYSTPKALPVFKNRAFCGPQVVNETLLIARDGGLKNAVVIVRAIDRSLAVNPSQLVLDNQRCAFAPHIQVAPLGSELLLKNSDSILHTVHARLGTETLFNVGLPKWRQVSKRLDRPGVVKIDCDVLHTWMSAAVIVSDSPYFAVSDERGWFFIEGLPVGIYDVVVWHERLGTRKQGLRVDDTGLLTMDVVFSAEKIR